MRTLLTAFTVVMLSSAAAFAQSSTSGTTQNQGSGAGTMTAPAGTTDRNTGSTTGTTDRNTGTTTGRTTGSTTSSTMSGTAPTALGSNEWSVDQLIGADVANNNDDDIGDIEDVVLGQDGRVKYVVVSVGGFLGMGDKHVAMNWDEVQASRTDDTVRVNRTKEQLEQAPEYKREARSTVPTR